MSRDPAEPFYRHHLFFCCNARDDGRESCNNDGTAQRLRDYCKEQVKKKGLNGVGRSRVNQAGCLDRCKLGPLLVIYPQGTWYRYDSEADIDEIVDEHLAQGRVVARLKI